MPPRPPPYLRRLLLLRPFSSPPSPSPFLHRHFIRPFSLSSDADIAQSLSSELLKPPESDPLPLPQRLDLSFSHLSLSPPLVLQVLDSSPNAGRAALPFLSWISSKLPPSDLLSSSFVHYFGRRKDFKSIDDVLALCRPSLGPLSFHALVDRLVRAGRPAQAVAAFLRMESDLGIPQSRASLNVVVSTLCDHGYAACAEKMVKDLAKDFFPDETVCDLLIKGWCVDGKLDEARRLAREMYRGGFRIGVDSYNAILDCVCRLCRKKDPFRLQSEAELVLVDMDVAGIPRNTETFNVLILNLCKIRRTEDAMGLFSRMGEWGCFPDETTFLVLIRSLYQAARVGEGDDMIDRMRSAGFEKALDRKAYYGFLKILCGIERIDHALTVFRMMKKGGCKPGVKSYELMIERFWAHGRGEKANALFKEGVHIGLPLETKVYKVDPRFLKKPAVVKMVKKRLTLPEKMVLKRKKLRKLRLSYVKKPRSTNRRMV